MQSPGGMHGSKRWGKFGELPFIEFPDWREHLPTDEKGDVVLDRATSMQLALLHSREYQDQIDIIYQSALALSLQRFDFDLQWFARTSADYDVFGNKNPPNDLLTLNNRAGFTRNLAAGGQFLADFANTFVWEFGDGQISRASGNMLFRLTQPLLRGAFRDVRLESLTQAERNLLYSVRRYARFRRSFFTDTVGSSGYLGLLAVSQSIRNQRSNLVSLKRNLDEHEALLVAGQVAPIQVDQVYQSYQRGRLNLLQSEQTLQAALDRFKIQLGLPPELACRLDETILAPFELNAQAFQRLDEENEALRIEILQFLEDPPTVEFLREKIVELQSDFERIVPLAEQVNNELSQWKVKLNEQQSRGIDADIQEDFDQRVALSRRMEGLLEEIRLSLVNDAKQLRTLDEVLETLTPEDAWDQLKDYATKNFRERLSDLLVIQTQIRVFLIEIDPVNIDEADALAIAQQNRLDLMNARGRVIDAYRRVEVAADQLESDLDLVLEADVATDRRHANAFRFDASANRYRAGVAFDSPINRLAERNEYRAAQLDYQAARRDFMAVRDAVARDIRDDLRSLEFNQFEFEITRQQLITAARQVEEAQIRLRNAQEDSSLTRDLLDALQQLLSAKNSLIGSWVSYETARMNLFRDLDTMQIDGEGVWINEYSAFGNQNASSQDSENERDPGVRLEPGPELIPPEPLVVPPPAN